LNWPPLSKPATPEETPGSTLFRQVGERRSDGFYFRGYQARPPHLGGRYECWASPTAWAQRAERRAAAERRYREKRDLDPKRRATSRAYAATHMVKQRRKDPVGFMLIHARVRAKKRGLDFDLTREDIVIPSHCPVFGFSIGVQKGGSNDNSAELDRIDNTKGYIKGNVVVVSRRANRIKNDAALSELVSLVEFYRSFSRVG
jgi:hypothetical protein